MPSALSPPGARNSSNWLPDSPAVVPFTPHFEIITAGGEQEVCPHVFNYLKRPVILTLQYEAGPVFVTSHLSWRNLGLHVASRRHEKLTHMHTPEH